MPHRSTDYPMPALQHFTHFIASSPSDKNRVIVVTGCTLAIEGAVLQQNLAPSDSCPTNCLLHHVACDEFLQLHDIALRAPTGRTHLVPSNMKPTFTTER